VAGIGAIAHTLEEPPRVSDGAAVLVNAWQHLLQTFGDAGNLVARSAFEIPDVQTHVNGPVSAVIVWTPKRPEFKYFHSLHPLSAPTDLLRLEKTTADHIIAITAG